MLAPASLPVQLNVTQNLDESPLAMSPRADGSTWVFYQSLPSGQIFPQISNVYARLVNAAGAPAGSEISFALPPIPRGSGQWRVSPVLLGDGTFEIVTTLFDTTNNYNLVLQHYSANGAPLGPPTAGASNLVSPPDLYSRPDGGFDLVYVALTDPISTMTYIDSYSATGVLQVHNSVSPQNSHYIEAFSSAGGRALAYEGSVVTNGTSRYTLNVQFPNASPGVTLIMADDSTTSTSIVPLGMQVAADGSVLVVSGVAIAHLNTTPVYQDEFRVYRFQSGQTPTLLTTIPAPATSQGQQDMSVADFRLLADGSFLLDTITSVSGTQRNAVMHQFSSAGVEVASQSGQDLFDVLRNGNVATVFSMTTGAADTNGQDIYTQLYQHVWPNTDPLFDPTYYETAYSDVAAAGVDPLAHYNGPGWHEGRNPDAFFNTRAYELTNPDVAAAGINPMLHYENNGWREGRDPSALFSTSLYLLQNPDVAAAGVDPLQHYLQNGMAEGRAAPAAIGHGGEIGDFDPHYYLLAYADVAAAVPAGMDPAAFAYQHYEAIGWREGRDPNAFFSTTGYLNAYADVRAAGINPLDHYENNGWHEGRDPSPQFDTQQYLAHYTDVAAAHIDPLQHYLTNGAWENRLTFGDGRFG